MMTTMTTDDTKIEATAAYNEHDLAMLARVRAWIDPDAGRDQATLGRLSGVKQGTMSQVISGKYPSSPTAWLQKLDDVVDRWRARQRGGLRKIPHTDISTFSMMQKIIGRAHRDADFGVIFGRVGIGKTIAVRAYSARSSSVLVEAFDGIDHGTVLRDLVTSSGAKVGERATGSAKLAAVIRALKGSDRVVLVDEAQWLPAQSLGALRRISDLAEDGVVLVGNPELEIRIADPDGRFGQITSRVGFWPPVFQEIPQEDMAAMARAFFAQAEVECGDEAVGEAARCANGSGRLLEKLLRNSVRSAQSQGLPITAELISKIYRDTFRGV